MPRPPRRFDFFLPPYKIFSLERATAAQACGLILRRDLQNVVETVTSEPLDATPEKVLVALSGGVDSAVAALELVEQGHDVAAAYMKNWMNEEDPFGECPWQADIRDAEAVAEQLGIPFRVLNFMADYRSRVVDYLIDGYARGLTPNPDVMCNREMKFGVLLDWALDNGFDAVATGHYCRRAEAPPGTRYGGGPTLLAGVDENKDQSYFLAMITRPQLERARFPVGHLRKPEVRARAKTAGLPNAGKKDSQGICFIGKVRMNDFLREYIPDHPGEIVNTSGKVLGTHRGLHRYTIGQRRGIGLPSNSDFNHYVVIAKEVGANRLVVAFEQERPAALWHASVGLHRINWIAGDPPSEPTDLLCKVRYRDPSVAARFAPEGPDSGRLVFKEEQRGLASGQVCALYDGERLLGGGIYP